MINERSVFTAMPRDVISGLPQSCEKNYSCKNIRLFKFFERKFICAIYFFSFLSLRSDTFDPAYNRCSSQLPNSLYPPPPSGFAFHHHSSFDELSSSKLNRNPCYPIGQVNFAEPQQPQQQEYQWPKVIPKSPSSFSMNSFRLHRQPPFNKNSTYNPIDEFDLDKIEYERRKSHTTLFKEKNDFGTAV